MNIPNATLGDRECNRQVTLLALAELSLSRPGWDFMLRLIADSLEGADLFELFKKTSRDQILPKVGGFLALTETEAVILSAMLDIADDVLEGDGFDARRREDGSDQLAGENRRTIAAIQEKLKALV